MTTASKPGKLATYAGYWCSLLIFFYTLLIFIFPANAATTHAYHLSATEYRIILFAFSLPSFFVWFTGFIGYAALRHYAYAIRKTAEGPQFKQLADGVTWLVWSMPVPTIMSLILNDIANHSHNFHPSAIIIINYVSLFLPLAAFTAISMAARNLHETTKQKMSRVHARVAMTLFIIFGVLYCYLTFHHLGITSLSSSHNLYFLPAWLLVLSLIMPYLYAWFVGALGAYKLALFGKNMPGLLYRKALLYIAWGIVAVIASSIALQYVNSVVPRTGHLVLDYRFGLNVLFRVISGVGFIMLAVGANRLKKIEEV